MPIDDEIRALERALLRSGKNVVVLPRELWDEAAGCLVEAAGLVNEPGMVEMLRFAPERVKDLCAKVSKIGLDPRVRPEIKGPAVPVT